MHFYTHFSMVGRKLYLKHIDNGQRKVSRLDVHPSLYVTDHDADVPYDQKTLDGKALREIDFDDVFSLKAFAKDMAGSGDLYGNHKVDYVEINKMFPGNDLEYDSSQVRVADIDIECECENGFPDPELAEEIVNAITLEIDDVYHVLSLFDFTTTRSDIRHTKYNNEVELLLGFVTLWTQLDIDIVTGWNIDFFDIPYLSNRINKILGEDMAKKLSPVNKISTRRVNTIYGERQAVKIQGIEILDYQQLYSKFTYVTRPSMKLDYIAHVEVGENKLDYSEEGGKLHLLYKNNPQKFIEYNIRDVELVKKIDNKLKLIDLAITLAYRMKVNYGDVFSQVNMWEAKMCNYMADRNIQPEFKTGSGHGEKFKGAFVKDPITGYYKWVCAFDLTSLYPKIIVQNNISPETMLCPSEFLPVDENVVVYDDEKMADITEQIKSANVALASNGSLYRRDVRGMFPEIAEAVFNERVIAKNKMMEAKTALQKESDPDKKAELSRLVVQFKNQQLAAKIQINSLYGAMGNKHFRWFNLHQAKAVTYTGQAVIKWVELALNEYMNSLLKTNGVDYVIYCDTDSAYLNVEPVVDMAIGDREVSNNKIVDFIDKFASEKVQKVIDKAYAEFAERTNAFENAMEMKREVIGSGVWHDKKKRYIMRIYDDEGVRLETPDMKIMGHEAVRSTYPDWCRQKMAELLEMIFTSTEKEAVNFIQQTKEEYMNLPRDDMAANSGVTSIDKYITENGSIAGGCQSHIRSAIYYNQLLVEHGLEKEYPVIKEGDKIKMVMLNKRLNPYGYDIIGYSNVLPPEFDLDKYVDKEEMFNKFFLDPIKRTFSIVGWKTDKKKNLLGLMKQ